MKTKLSFLALPLYVGLIFTFVLAACGGGSGGGESEVSSSSIVGGYTSSGSTNEAIISVDEFYTEPGASGKINVLGVISATKAVPVVKVEFTTSWITAVDYGLPIKTVDLTGTYIDLTNPAIPCGEHEIGVKGCTDATCKVSAESAVATANAKFEKPQSYCNSSSSEAIPSSSSEASWVFGAGTPGTAAVNVSQSIGPGSFKLTGDGVMDTQPGLEITGGTVRDLGLISMCGDDDVPVVGKPYPSASCLGNTVPTKPSLDPDFGVQHKGYYLIYFGSSAPYTIYLVRFEVLPPTWPKNYTYWPVTEHP